ncbi:MAG: hypothetical protein AAF633_26310 [Chloroflexota bacterium]
MNWILSFSYLLHLIATVVWLGGIAINVLMAVPALARGTIDNNQWLMIQKKFTPYANISMAVLLVSGFYQMTSDPNYGGFMVLDGIWAWSMLFKHVAYVGMVAILIYFQFVFFPEVDRLTEMFGSKPTLLEEEMTKSKKRERSLLITNVVCGFFVLLFTAIATAV